MRTYLLIIVLILTIFSSSTGLCESNLPSRNPDVAVPLLQKIKNGQKISKVFKILGPANEELGSGLLIWSFDLDDESIILLGSADGEKVLYIYNTDQDMENRRVLHKERKRSEKKVNLTAEPRHGS